MRTRFVAPTTGLQELDYRRCGEVKDDGQLVILVLVEVATIANLAVIGGESVMVKGRRVRPS